jgi:hypothetical protein
MYRQSQGKHQNCYAMHVCHNLLLQSKFLQCVSGSNFLKLLRKMTESIMKRYYQKGFLQNQWMRVTTMKL